jgi:YebC/PmpR family DNA-binding regulatory protein
MIVEALTDNRNRTAGAVRSYFTRYGGALGETGSVGFLFDRVGEIVYPAKAASTDQMLEAAIEAGAEDAESGDDGHRITCAFSDLSDVARALEDRFGEAETVKSVWQPQTTTSLDEERAATMMKLITALEDDDDVQNVYSNFEVSDALMEKLTAA